VSELEELKAQSDQLQERLKSAEAAHVEESGKLQKKIKELEKNLGDEKKRLKSAATEEEKEHQLAEEAIEKLEKTQKELADLKARYPNRSRISRVLTAFVGG
jgi:chromosome segregation ATPase